MTVEPSATDKNFSILIPDWPLPPGVRSIITTRPGSSPKSDVECASLLGLPAATPKATAEAGGHDKKYDRHYDDVQSARYLLARQLGLSLKPQWLQQEHGATVVEALANAQVPIADASFTGTQGLACVVLTADCLPLLLSSKDGSLVAAVHGGWRGLARGIIGATVAAMGADPTQIMAYLGPAISSRYFEVGPEVLQAFLETNAGDNALKLDGDEVANCFRPSALTAGHYFADLYGLARVQLNNLGVVDIYGGEYCTYAQDSLFYSHRRSRDIGRMASLIWIDS